MTSIQRMVARPLPVPRRALGIAAAGLGLAAFAWLVYLGLTWDLRSAGREAAAAFRSAVVARGNLRETVVATGTMEPLARVVVQSEIPGIVGLVHVDDGDRVERDQPLVELNDERLRDHVALLRAGYEWRRALVRVNVVGRAQAERAKLRRDQRRTAELFARGITSQHDLDDALHLLALAEIAVADAAAERDARGAAAEQAARALERAERDLAMTTIRSPIDGVVERREVEVGTAVADLQNGGTVVVVLADDQRIHLLAEVDENDVASVGLGQPAQVSIDAFPDEVFDGFVRKVASSGKSAGSVSNFEVEIEIDSDARIRVGMTADARIVVGEHRSVLLVPNGAIVRTDAGPRVRRARDAEAGAFDLVEIREIYSDGFQTAIGAGLAEGDVVLLRADGPTQWQP